MQSCAARHCRGSHLDLATDIQHGIGIADTDTDITRAINCNTLQTARDER